MGKSTPDRTERIRRLNDLHRCSGVGGPVIITTGLQACGAEFVGRVIKAVAAFAAFTADNDPYGEHDCASCTVNDLKIIWKIDYYDLALKHHSPDPSDPSVTARIMTVMLAEEY